MRRNEKRRKKIARLQRENRRLSKRLNDIGNSTSWKLTYPFRHIGHQGIRRVLRRLAYGGWAIVSLRAFGRENTGGG